MKVKAKRSEGKWSDSEEASGSEGEIPVKYRLYTETFIYPLEQLGYIKI